MYREPIVELHERDADKLEDLQHEEKTLLEEIAAVKDDGILSPTQKMKKITELRESLSECRSEIRAQAHGIFENYLH